MKNFLLLALIFTLTACSTNEKKRIGALESEDQDAFKEESFLRYSKTRLTNLDKGAHAPVAQCYLGKYKEGLALLKKRVKEEKKSPSYWNQVGMCYFLKGDLSKAEHFFDTSIEYSKKTSYLAAYNNLGMLRVKQRRLDQALALFKKSAKGKFLTPKFNMAQIYLSYGLTEKAEKELLSIYKLNKKDGDINMGLGLTSLLKGNIKKSLDYIKQVPEEAKGRDDIAFIYALTLYQDNKYKRALNVLKGKSFKNHFAMKKSSKKLVKLINKRLKEIKQQEEAKKKNQEKKRKA